MYRDDDRRRPDDRRDRDYDRRDRDDDDRRRDDRYSYRVETATTRNAARRTAEHVSVNARASVRARETATATACLNAAALL